MVRTYTQNYFSNTSVTSFKNWNQAVTIYRKKGYPDSPPPIPVNNPYGYLDVATGGNGTVYLYGWTMDDDDKSQSLRVDFYLDGPAGQGGIGIGSTIANFNRSDVGSHGFNVTLDVSKYLGQHTIYAYGINIGSGTHTILKDPKAVTIQLPNITQDNVNYSGENINSNGDCYSVSSITAQASGYVSFPSTVNGHRVHRVAREVFKNRTNVTGVYIPDSCYRIGSECFMNCSGLESIRIPNTITEFGTDVFTGCNSLKHIFFSGDESVWNTKLPEGIRNTLKATGATIHFDERTSYAMPESDAEFVLCLEPAGFYIKSCNNVSGKLEVPGTALGIKINRVAAQAFDGKSQLTEISFPEGLTRIGKYGLANCPGLKKVVLPRSLLSLGVTILAGSDKLEKVFYRGARAEFEKVVIDDGELGASCGLTVLYDMAKSNGRTLADGDYHIVTKQVGIGLDIAGGSTANNTNVQVYNNADNDDQVFHVTYLGDGYYKITSKKSGLSLDVEGGSLKTRANVQMHTDNGTAGQQWIIKEADDNYNYYIIAGCNGQALDVADGLFQNGTNVRTWEKIASDAQKWHFIRWNKDVGQTVADGDYRIISVLDHSYGLNVEGASAEDGANINIRANTKDKKQVFHITYTEDGFYNIVNKYTNTGLYATGANPYRGNNVTARSDLSSKSMRWGIGKSVNGDYYNVYCNNGGGYLDIDGGIISEGRNVKLWGSNWGAGQDWLFIPDEDQTINAVTKDLNVTLTWNKLSWADSYDLNITDGSGKDFSRKNLTETNLVDELPAGAYTAYITSKNEVYSLDSDKITFTTKRSAEDTVIKDIKFEGKTFTYDGTAKSLAITQILPEGITVKYSGNDQTEAGTYTVTAQFLDNNGQVIDVKPAELVIQPKDVLKQESGVAADKIPDQTYSGKPVIVEPVIKDTVIQDTDKVLEKDKDYTLDYTDNTNAGTATVKITFKGNYSGNIETSFNINKATNKWEKALSCEDILFGETLRPLAEPTFGKVNYRYATEATGTYMDEEPTKVGSYYVKAFVAGTDNFTSLESDPVAVKITKAVYDLSGITFEDETVTYDGEPKSLAIKGQLPQGVKVSYEGNEMTDAGEYNVAAQFEGNVDNYEGIQSLTAKLTIEPRKVLIPEGYNDLVYTGQELNGIWESEDYTITSGGSATEAGQHEAVLRLNDKKNTAWEDGTTTDKIVVWTISNSGNEWTRELTCPDVTYGETPEPSAEAKYGNVEYSYSKDAYEAFTTKAPTEAGTYFVRARVKETNEYSGLENIMEFTIKKASYDLSGVTFDDTSVTYDGKLKNLTIKGNLPEGVDVSYEGNGNVNAGEYEVTASFTGDENHEQIPDQKATLTILPKGVDSLTFGSIANRVYTGKAMEPEVDVEDAYIPLTKGREYDVDYKNNVEAGTAKAVITLKGNYAGTKEIPFTIRQAKNSFKAELSCDDIPYGETPKPSIEAKFGTAKYIYSNQENGTYSDSVPKESGTWFVKATVDETANYTGLESEPVQFMIADHKHVWDNGKVTKEPTCTETGIRTFTCKDCKETREEVISAKGHKPVTDKAVAPTTAATGLTEGSHCSVCGTVLKKQEVVPKLNKPAQETSTQGAQKTTEVPTSPSNKDNNNSQGTTGNQSIPVTSLQLSGLSTKIAAGKKVRLSAAVLPENATNKGIVWATNNKKVATVNQNGVVSVKKKTGGKSVIITAMAADGSGIKAQWKIKSMKGMVKSVVVKGAKPTLQAGKALKLKAVVKSTKGANKKLKWISSNPAYATVNAKGVVKALKDGKGKTVKITVMATDGSNKKKVLKLKIK